MSVAISATRHAIEIDSMISVGGCVNYILRCAAGWIRVWWLVLCGRFFESPPDFYFTTQIRRRKFVLN